ncbi:MAG: hypothetical protein AMXMBFR42_05680 [Burkholderiales bacterium]
MSLVCAIAGVPSIAAASAAAAPALNHPRRVTIASSPRNEFAARAVAPARRIVRRAT